MSAQQRSSSRSNVQLQLETLEQRLAPALMPIGISDPTLYLESNGTQGLIFPTIPSSTPSTFTSTVTTSVASQSRAAVNSFSETNLVSDQQNVARFTDSHLVNAWGIARTKGGSLWVADNGAGTVTLYSASGRPMPAVITIPKPDGTPGGAPTGIVVNDTSGFRLKNGARATFIVATEDGTIVAWGPSLGSQAEIEVNNSANGAVYKGLTMGRIGHQWYLFATDFHNGKIDVYDSSFHLVTTLPGHFVDQLSPAPLPAGAVGYGPFGIRYIDGLLYVTYAAQNNEQHDDVAGAGAGFVDVFRTDGTFVRRLATGGSLNSPFGLAEAPDHFGPFGDAILVGNFGDGTINAFDPVTGAFLGQLSDSTGKPIHISGLWGLDFGGHGHRRNLFFAVGPNHENDGLFGELIRKG
jgi:uncharacterized protein (TIGR03118 family)